MNQDSNSERTGALKQGFKHRKKQNKNKSPGKSPVKTGVPRLGSDKEQMIQDKVL